MLSPSTIDSFKEISKLSLMISPIWARLIGAPPGYVGYEDGGQLTWKV